MSLVYWQIVYNIQVSPHVLFVMVANLQGHLVNSYSKEKYKVQGKFINLKHRDINCNIDNRDNNKDQDS